MDGVREEICRTSNFEIDLALASLRCGDDTVHLRPKTFQVLLYLVEQRDRLVAKDELIANLWPGVAVTDDTVVQCIADLRRAFGDDPRRPLWIQTIPKVGYRFIGKIEILAPADRGTVEVEEVTTVEAEIVEEVEDTARLPFTASVASLSRRALILAFTALTLLLAVAIYGIWPERRPTVEATLPQTPGKRPVAVLHFENQSGSLPLDWLREGLADMLITGLSRSPQLTVLSRPQLAVLLNRIGHTPGRTILLDEGLDIAQRSHAELLVTGGFARLGNHIRVDVRCHDGRNGQLRFAESLTVDRPEQLLTAIDLLSLKIASRLDGGPAWEHSRPAATGVSTTSLEAYRCYSLALEKAPALDNAEAIALLERAVALDPEFAMAYARIGYAYAVTWDFADKAKPYLERAFQLSHRLTEKEKLYIKAWYAIANLDFDGAMVPLREVIALDPHDIEAYWRLGCLLEGEDRFESAIDVLKLALVVDPEAKDIYNTLGFLYADIGDHASAEAMINRHIELAPAEPNAWNSLGLVYDWAGRYEDAIAAYRQSLKLDPVFDLATVHLGNTYFHQGRYRMAIEQYRRFIAVARTQVERARGWGRIAWLYLKKGDRARAEAAALKEVALEPTAVFNSVLLALDRGNFDHADELMGQTSRFSYTSRGARTSRRYPAFIQGAIALKLGRVDEALERFRATLGHRPPIWAIDAYEDCLANAFLTLGRYDEAIAEYQRILRLNPRYPLAHFHLAEAYRLKGDAGLSSEELKTFREAWKSADADLPEVLASGG